MWAGHEVFIDFLNNANYSHDPHIKDALFVGSVSGPLTYTKASRYMCQRPFVPLPVSFNQHVVCLRPHSSVPFIRSLLPSSVCLCVGAAGQRGCGHAGVREVLRLQLHIR